MFIGAAGNSAEMPNPGVLTQFVGRSGGARLSANLYYDYENDGIQSRNLPAEASIPSPGATIRPDGNRLASYKNLNLSVGGPIVPERLWGYFAYLNQQNSTAAPPSGSILDGTPFNTKLFNYTGKATYQLNQKNRFVGYIQHGTKQQPNRTDSSNRLGAPVHILGDSTVLQDSPSWVFKGEWNGTLTQNLFAEFRAGQFGYNFGLDSNTGDIRYESLTTNEILGGGREWLLKRRRNQVTGAVSYFKDNFVGGSHQFKVGGEYLGETGETIWNQTYADNVIHFVNGSLQSGVLSTTPAQVRLGNNVDSLSALATTSAFVTDTWRIDRLTMSLGARSIATASGCRSRRCRRGGSSPIRSRSRRSTRSWFSITWRQTGRELRPRRQWQDGPQRQLGAVLLQPRCEPGRFSQSKYGEPVYRPHLERPEQRPRVSGRRGRRGADAIWWRGERLHRSESQKLVRR